MLRALLFQHLVLSNSVFELKLPKFLYDGVVLLLRGFEGLEKDYDIVIVLCVRECGILFVHMELS